MYEGAKLFESYFFLEGVRNILLDFDNPKEEKLRQREIHRLLSKGCIKINNVSVLEVGVFYEYKLTEVIKNKISHYEN